MIGRRHQLAAMLSTLVAPRLAAAQERRRPRLAIFAPVFPEAELSEAGDPLYRIIFGELRRRGYEEGRTISVERWSARGNPARYAELAGEIVRSQPDVIYTVNNGQVRALLAFTTTIPIVAQNANLMDAGIAESFSRSGRNVTGFGVTFSGLEFVLKQLQLLREAVPTASRIAILGRRTAWDSDIGRQFREAASRTGANVVGAPMDEPIGPAEYRRVFAAMPEQRVDAVWVGDFPANYVHRHLIIDLATDSRRPVITSWREATGRGGLMSYGGDLAWLGRTSADLVVRVLQGEKPADLPLVSGHKWELVVNLKTARALGLTVPPAILARADEVIE
jgi:putative ABC transport system substrate-binding protein